MTAVPEVLLGDFTAVQCRNWRSRARRSLGCLCRNDEYTASVLVTRDVGCRPYRIEDFQIAMRHEPEGLPILLGLRHISNRSRVYRNGNWKMATGDWRRKATSPEPKVRNLPAKDSGAPAQSGPQSTVWKPAARRREYRQFSRSRKGSLLLGQSFSRNGNSVRCRIRRGGVRR
jgi:hypothetical protein